MPMSPYMKQLRALVGHELILVPAVNAFIFDDAGRLLLARHLTHGVWAPPGGAVDPGESPAEAVAREVREELGMEVRPVRVLGVFGGPSFEHTYDGGDRVAYVMTSFECAIVAGAPKPDGVEIDDVRYFDSFADLEGLKLPRWAPEVLPRVWPRRAEAVFQADARPGNLAVGSLPPAAKPRST